MTIGIFFRREPKINRRYGPLYVEHLQFESYVNEMIDEGERQGHRVVVLCKSISYKSAKKFSYYWEKTDKLGWFRLVEELIEIDLIYDKGYFREPAPIPILNAPGLASLGRDKLAQNKLFGHLQPKTTEVFVNTEGQIDLSTINFVDSRLVLKPNDKNGGRDIQILVRDELAKQKFTPGRRYLVQEFIDSSMGIPGVIESMHDVRFYMLNGKPAISSIRVPAKGKFVSNTSQGGQLTIFDPKLLLNSDSISLLNEVDNKLEKYGARYYSIDCIYGNNRWWLIEINDRPGTLARFQDPRLVPDFHEQLIKCIVSAESNPINKNALIKHDE